MKRVYAAFVFVLLTISVYAQESSSRRSERRERINAMIKQEEEGNLSYLRQNGFGIQLRTNGYGVFFEIGRRRSQRFTNTYMIELTEIKHSKEEKVGGAENFFGSPYVFGKVNNFYQLKLGMGQQYIVGQKGNRNGVAILALAHGGLSAGLLKPYYINIPPNMPGGSRTIKYDSPDSTLFLERNDLNTAAGFTKGWSELKLAPGLFAKTALRFDFGRYNEHVQAVEIGISADYYFREFQIIAWNEPKHLFVQGHIAFVFGRRK